MMKKIEKCIEFCNGCGLCHAEQGVSFWTDEKGFSIPNLNEENLKSCEQYCPILSKESAPKATHESDWGEYETCYMGYASDEGVRFRGSSGGVISALAIFLLEEKKINAVLHIGRDPKCPYRTKLFCSRTKEEILSHAGSRYSVSMPLYDLDQYLDTDDVFCFIGKPCDVQALYSYRKNNKKLQDKIPYLLSFFCAGTPSEDAQKRLLQQLGVKGECVHLEYRGNGWPGSTVAINNSGEKYEMDYGTSWSTILGRDVRKSCRFCYDGIGLYADVVCADAWYIKEDGSPDFSEHKGRNAIIARTKDGVKILEEAISKGYLNVFPYDIDELTKIQKYQFDRRGTMLSKIMAMKMLFRVSPDYRYDDLKRQSNKIVLKRHFIIFAGTIRRILQKRI